MQNENGKRRVGSGSEKTEIRKATMVPEITLNFHKEKATGHLFLEQKIPMGLCENKREILGK